MEVTRGCLETFANEGLRTLLICQRLMPQDLYDEWLQKYEAAKNIPNESKRKKTIRKTIDWLENDFEVLGSTAVEDNL